MKLIIDLESGADIQNAFDVLRNYTNTPSDLDINPTPDGIKLDSEGYPHDKRIHSGGESQTKEGTWKLKKTPKDQTKGNWLNYINQVKAELKRDVEPVAPVTTGSQFADRNTDDSVKANEVFGSNPPGFDPTQVAVVTAPMTYDTMLAKAMTMIQTNELVMSDVQAACMACGVVTMQEAQNNPELVAKLVAILFP